MSNYVPVTVIVPCYNSADTLSRAVNSVLLQTLPPAALLLIDDASTDNTREMLRELEQTFPGRVRAISLPENRGPSYARNTGWDAATTEFVAFLDADDEWHSRKLEIQLDWFAKHPNAMMCGHQCIEHSGCTAEIGVAPPVVRSFTLRDMLVSNRFSTPSVMLRRSIRHRFPVSRRHAEDYHLWLSIAADVGHLERIELPLAWYFKPAFGASGLSANLWAMEKGELSVLKELRDRGDIGAVDWLTFSLLSFAKYARRAFWHKNRIGAATNDIADRL